ncbi:MAG: hypothetical protein D6730_12905 [Bacteroidetes bacterium]|nr:MAG: hypothetical protein D6730_12905 [Bacteroidota bacterium]
MRFRTLFQYAAVSLCCLLAWGFSLKQQHPSFAPPALLSEYGFFQGNMADQAPAAGVMPYQLNTPLFSDYAQKLRFVKLPPGKQAAYHDTQVLDFPVGSMLIKTFYYPYDERKPQKGRRLIETRVLIHEASGWKAYPYIWNEAQTDATLEVAGGRMEVKWTRANGKKQKLEYVVPNVNECKGCHSYDGAFKPIGPTARQLNGDFPYPEGAQNQLLKWQQAGLLAGLPELEQVPRIAVWNDPATGDLNSRARAWLDINCAHCHNPHGPANTSGLFLDIHQPDGSAALGVMKPPVAAGRGAGDSQYDILPGQPDASILMFRIASNDPGIRMPEIGRKLVHEEGVALIREWISSMQPAR